MKTQEEGILITQEEIQARLKRIVEERNLPNKDILFQPISLEELEEQLKESMERENEIYENDVDE